MPAPLTRFKPDIAQDLTQLWLQRSQTQFLQNELEPFGRIL